MDLLNPVLGNDKLLSKVDFEFPFHLNGLIQTTKINYFSSIPEIDSKIENYQTKQDFGTVSKFYFYFIEAIRFFTNRILDYIEDLQRKIQHLRQKAKESGP